MKSKIILLYIAILYSIAMLQAQQSGSLEDTNGTQQEEGFIQGSRIIYSDNFSKDAIGDFPAKWTSTKVGEVKKLNGFNERYLKIWDGSVVSPQLTKILPENFTLSFDIIVPGDVPIRMASFGFGIKPFVISNLLSPKDGFVFSFHSSDRGIADGLKFGTKNAATSQPGLQKINFKTPLNNAMKVDIAVNKARIRLYVDGVKMIDMPTAFNSAFRKSFFFCPSTHGAKESKLNYFYISNLVIAEAGKDKRSMVLKDLLEKGSVSTSAIQFATNSDQLTSASSDVIQQFVEAMKEEPTLKLKIIGHTDADGDEAKNLILSKKRAAAVKTKMIVLGITANRLLTDGKGEKEPIADNSTVNGKLQNRRVEFVKL